MADTIVLSDSNRTCNDSPLALRAALGARRTTSTEGCLAQVEKAVFSNGLKRIDARAGYTGSVRSAEQETSGYISVGLLARGGMGEVELGLRKSGNFQRLVAIKRLRTEYKDDPSFRRMFLEEAKIAGLIRHPNVVSVLDVGDDHRGPFLVMEFIEGLTVSKVLKSAAAAHTKLPLQIAARIVQQVALGLAAAHALTAADGSPLGLIHRDVSPQNIMLGFDGVARLTDFGIAKALSSNKETTTGLLKGKVGYMSPEQLRFDTPSQKSDLFSLGVVMFELLSAKRLYAGKDTPQVAKRILTEPTPDIFAVRDDVPTALIELSFELLAKDPDDRPRSAEQVAVRLGEIIDELTRDEGSIHLADYLTTQHGEEWTAVRSKSDSLVKDWEQATSISKAVPTGARRPGRAVAVALAIASAALLLMYAGSRLSSGADALPTDSSAESVDRTTDDDREDEHSGASPETPTVTGPNSNAMSDEGAEEPTDAEDRAAATASERRVSRRQNRARAPHMRTRPPRMTRPTMESSFSAIDLIRGAM